MRKCFFLLCAALLPALAATAKGISETEARQIAAEFLNGKRKVKTEVVLCNPFAVTRTAERETAEPAFYIYNSADGKGYAIVSAEDRLPAIVGYSTAGHIEGSMMPDAMRLFLDSYAEYVEDVRTGKKDAQYNTPLATSARPERMEPMVKTEWNQPAPYNYYCPDNCPAGCIAVAMAQVMKYHEWPKTGTGSSFTTYNGKALEVDFSQSEYRWEAMKNTTTELNNDEVAAEAVAKLIYDCGIGAKMTYGPNGSGAYDVDEAYAMMNYFGYKNSTISMDKPEYYATKDEWTEKILGEIAAGRPVLFSGASPSGGGGDAAGHAFVLSGYDETNMVHVNWGWGGEANGFFDLFRLDPGAYAFTEGQTAICGIVPNRDGIDSEYIPVPFMAPMTTETKEVNLGTSFTISMKSIGNYNPTNAKWQYGIGLYKTDGTFIENIQKMNFSIPPLEPYYKVDINDIICTIPAATENGEYIIRMFFKSNGNFIEPRVEGGAMNNYLRAVVADGKVKIDKEPTVTAIGNVKADDNAAMKEYYSVSGQRITSPSSRRIVIVKQGNKVRKMIAK